MSGQNGKGTKPDPEIIGWFTNLDNRVGIIGLIVILILLGAVLFGTLFVSRETAPVTQPPQQRGPGPRVLLAPCAEDPDLLRYMQELYRHQGDVDRAIGNVANLLTLAAANPSLYRDADWVFETTFWLGAVQTFEDDLNDMRVPSRFRSTHARLQTAADYYVRAADATFVGIDRLDANAMNRSSRLLEQATAAVHQANAALEAACPQ